MTARGQARLLREPPGWRELRGTARGKGARLPACHPRPGGRGRSTSAPHTANGGATETTALMKLLRLGPTLCLQTKRSSQALSAHRSSLPFKA